MKNRSLLNTRIFCVYFIDLNPSSEFFLRGEYFLKKILIYLFFTLGLITSIFADGYYVGNGMSGKRLAIHEPEFKNINLNDSVYLYDLVFILRT